MPQEAFNCSRGSAGGDAGLSELHTVFFVTLQLDLAAEVMREGGASRGLGCGRQQRRRRTRKKKEQGNTCPGQWRGVTEVCGRTSWDVVSDSWLLTHLSSASLFQPAASTCTALLSARGVRLCRPSP